MLKRIASCSLILALTLSLTACNELNALRAGIQAVSPAVEYLIGKGLITREKADLYRADATKLLNGFDALNTAWKGDRSAKLAAIQAFANTTVAPIARDFANIPQLSEAMLILNTTIAVIQGFYGGGPPAASPNAPRTEKQLADYVKAQNEKIKAALAH